MGVLHFAALAALPLVLAQNSSNPGAQPFQTSPPKYPSPWGEGLGDWAGAYAQARAFVSQLSLLEKVNLTTGVGWEGEKCVGNNGAIPRLGFKALCMQDSPLGVRLTDYVSAFPAQVHAAATWDRDIIYQRGLDMGAEHREKGVDVQLGPVVGPIGRSPEGGRNWEGFSPDPFLSGVAVAQTVKGIQAAGVMACTKHYVGNEQEHFRQGGTGLADAISSNIDDTTLHELYVWPFADAVRAGTASVMCSYNQVNNSYSCQNSYLQNYILKNELGFQGFIMSDWGAQHSGVSSALAGLDMTMPGDVGFDSATSFWGPNLTIAVLNGTVPQWRLDDMCVRILAAWYYVDRESNQVENAPTFSSWTEDTFGYSHFFASEDYTQVNYHINVQDDHAQHIRTAAAAGTVLLKNNGSLPLTGKEQLVTIFGSDAGENQYGPNGCSDRGCDNGTLAMGWGSGTANFPYLITPLEAIKGVAVGLGSSVEDVTDDYAYAQINALARKAQQVNGPCIVFANSDSGEGYITVDGNEGDRNNLTLWHNGDDLIANVTSQCSNTIVVMHTVGPVLVTPWYQNPNVTAIIWAGIPGQESGNAIADILYGKVNPGGKTPFTWGATRESYGTDIIYTPNEGSQAPQDDFTEGIFIDYRGFDKRGETPIYEFGFGLSYTTFSYANLQVQAHSTNAYTPTTGQTPAAPTYGSISNNTADYVLPAGFVPVSAYIYPYINSTDLQASSGDPAYGGNYSFPAGSSSGVAQPRLPAGSADAPGGNDHLYDVLFTVTVDITNTGKVVGDEVAQLYVALGGPNDAPRVLRGFDRKTINVGQTVTYSFDITRRDVSNWDTVSQDWIISNYAKTVYVGSSSRQLPLQAPLNVGASSSGGNSGSTKGSSPASPSTTLKTSVVGSASQPQKSATSIAGGASQPQQSVTSATSTTQGYGGPGGYSWGGYGDHTWSGNGDHTWGPPAYTGRPGPYEWNGGEHGR
ncbi:hypothetical protein AMS68_000996 [Peltaster fructicola]|uniref:beta-glucosidase n=2 Tax=Fungi TaxID=4751 RepID=A0A6H0XLH7_9PEZI|nr:hypothetical protein AMS68_000996 [Peltaster fructicola]